MTETSHQIDADVMGRYKNIVRHRLLIMGVLVLAIFGCLLLDFTMGPSGLTLSSLWQTLIDPASADAGTRVIVWDIRLPYALMAVVIGLSLGLAGAEMQTILNNSLASPLPLASLLLRPLVRHWRLSQELVFQGCPISGLFPLMPLFLLCLPH
uniref:Uncharacterized protein n=1 Tax=Yersinia enterocolitica W22703 TaxID=913028 RepID=F4MZ50_YEREN|nr:hypothetical protein YEW_CY12140 [Yersinia enterocolitica W22703]